MEYTLGMKYELVYNLHSLWDYLCVCVLCIVIVVGIKDKITFLQGLVYDSILMSVVFACQVVCTDQPLTLGFCLPH